LNAADQAIYTALNVISPTRGAGSAAMLGAKGLQAGAKAASHLPGAKGLRNVDLVTPTAQAIEKAPVIKRFNQINNAMGHLITRKQLAGMQPGVMQGATKTVRPWYKGGKFGHLGVMARGTLWNMGHKMTNNQDAWLRAHYGVTANVYKELERLGNVMDSARKQAEIKTPDRFEGRKSSRRFLDENGNMLVSEDVYFEKKISPERQAHLVTQKGEKQHYKSVKQVLEDASNQYHAQIAYNVSVLEKFKPGDPRIARLQEGGIDRYVFPNHKVTTLEGLKKEPKIIQDLVGSNMNDDLIRNHISPKIASDMNLKGNKVHISTKPFFTGTMMNSIGKSSPAAATGLSKSILMLGRTVVKDGNSIKFTANKHAPYIDRLLKIIQATPKGRVLTKNDVIKSFETYNKEIMARPDFGVRKEFHGVPVVWKKPRLGKHHLFDIQYLKKNIVDDGEFISISQQILTNDTLLATMPVRLIINKRNPSEGYFIMYDQMKQGSGVPLLESGLDIGSDVNRIYIDVQPLDADYVWKGKVPKVKDVVEPKIKEKDLGERVRQRFDIPPTEEFLRKRRFGRSYTPPLIWASKRGTTAGLLAQDENV
jgi:hypothetical protein